MKPPGSYFNRHGKIEEKRGVASVRMAEWHAEPEAFPSPSPPVYPASRRTSSPSSRYTAGEFGLSSAHEVDELRAEVTSEWLHVQQQRLMWTRDGFDEGVIVKCSRHSYISCPPELSKTRGHLYDAVEKLNVRAAMTIQTNVIKIFLRQQDQPYISLENGLRLQILPDITHLPTCQKHHFAAFIQDTGRLVVWEDNPSQIIARAKHIEKELISKVSNSLYNQRKNKRTAVIVTEEAAVDDEEEYRVEEPRRVVLFHSILIACTLLLLTAAIGGGWRQIAKEIGMDKNMLRLAFAAVVPLQIWLGLFFMQSIVVGVAQIIGPVSQTDANTKYYSGTPPVRNRDSGYRLPHITIQCPVFKEGLHAVLMPTIRSLKTAISTYEMQGGSANIFVNDDGMQLLSQKEAQMRQDFYDENNIGWVARPKHNTDVSNGEPIFARAGRFKKASNMNYALAVSNRVEEKLQKVHRSELWTDDDESNAYSSCLRDVVNEDAGMTWAEGNIRIGDYILLVDSDTRVPADCFLDAATEMELSPEVAIIQFPSGVLNITDSFFENGISFFTSLIYMTISYIVACGDIPPFVGHNALLRWSAIQEVAFEDSTPSSEGRKYTQMHWSEKTVSEDFDMALRLQTVGYVIRLASYKGTEFKEGVSLTVYDELARWKKYAYGCSELVFHPFRHWFTRGPFTPLFRKFIGSSMPLSSKLSIFAYIGTYYAIGSAWLLITANLFLVGWYYQNLDHYYIDSFKIFFSVVVVFSGIGNVSLAILRYRMGVNGLLPSFYENFKWILLLYIFFGGISMHVSEAILSHLFSVDMTWTATAKEVENTTFFLEIPKLLRRFKVMFTFCLLMIAGMIYVSRFAPPFWRINEFTAIFPLSMVIFTHVMLPIGLNPNLMLFTW